MIERAIVEQWLTEEGIEVSEAELTDPAALSWAFNFRVGPFSTLVAHRAVESNHLRMQMAVAVADEHLAVLRDVGSDMRDRFMFDLRLALLSRPVGYSLEFGEEGDADVLSKFTIGYNLLEDPLQKAGLFRRHHQMQSAAYTVVEMIRKLARFKEWR